jgi:5-methylcytosine-specific restriction endonuclease McrA
MRKFGTPEYGRKMLKLERRLKHEPLLKKATLRIIGYQGKRSKWKGVNEFPENHINDKRKYYRSEYLKSNHWRELRKTKLATSKICERCGANKRLDIHHKVYKNLYDVTLSDLETLCRKCHSKEHNLITCAGEIPG